MFVFRDFFIIKEAWAMEFLTGVKEKKTLEISELHEKVKAGQQVKVNGAVHAVRDMG